MIRRTRLRRVGPKSARRADAIKRLLPALRRRAGNRCENTLCRRAGKLDPHHIQKRSQGGGETLDNFALLCRPCHDWTDFPRAHPMGRLEIERDGAGHRFFIVRTHTRTPL